MASTLSSLARSRAVAILRELSKRAVLAVGARTYATSSNRPIWPSTVLYESFAGNGALDNPEALFRRMLERPDAQGFRHIWALRPGTGVRFRREFASSWNVRFVRYRSPAYHRALARASFLVNNATFPPEFTKRPGQVYLNTWHGTPLKRMGFDMPDGAIQSANVLRNFLTSDVLLSQNSWMSEHMYRGAYKLAEIFRGSIIEVGYPRMDEQFALESRATPLRAELGIEGGKLILIAPTWAGRDFSHPRDESARLLAVVTALQAELGDEYIVKLKVHQSAYPAAAAREDLRGILLPNEVPTNRVLALTHHLVTDHSSIIFDFLGSDGRISFLIDSDSDFLAHRGSYFGLDDLPGPVLSTTEQLARRIVEHDDPWAQRRADWASRFLDQADGSASDRAIDAMLSIKVPAPSSAGGTKRSMLIYAGTMHWNGITSSLLSLLRLIDYSHWDVTVLAERVSAADEYNLDDIDQRARLLIRTGSVGGGPVAVFGFKVRQLLFAGGRSNARDEAAWRTEARRVFGDSEFDVAIDFSGYSRFWTQLILHAPAARRLIWLHNDMRSEVTRTVNGKQRMRRSLPAIFRLYRKYDALVSVSQALEAINQSRVGATYGVPPERFTFARNTIDDAKICERAAVPIAELEELDAEVQRGWISELGAPGTFWFVTAGRLSREKNHARLLDAFDRVHSSDPRARLLIVGDGWLHDEIAADIERRSMSNACFLAGSLANPFPLIAAAQCFVLSSDYEGQPMVLLEAATLGLPIVTTRFDSVDDALPAGIAIVTENTAAALAEGMLRQISNPPVYDFSPKQYNGAALREFESVVRPTA